MNEKQLRQITAAMLSEANQNPPSFALLGLSGTGKTSVINVLFKTGLDISHTSACTKEFTSLPIGLKMTQGAATGSNISLRVVDCPGLGEDISLEEQYIEHYKRHLPAVDVILYLSAARNRGGVALEQQHLQALKNFGGRMVFGLSQIDLVEPGDFNERMNRPSEKQTAHIKAICEDRGQRFATVLERAVEFVPFSARYGYGLQTLFTALIMACSQERSWLFESLKGFDWRSFYPAAVLEQIGSK